MSEPIGTMSIDEYLEFENRSQERHEFVNGYVFLMSGASEAHHVICTNLATALQQRLRGTGCRAYVNGMKVHAKRLNSVYYPDIMIKCTPVQPDSVMTDVPVAVMEVLSPSTQHIDRREKMVAYRCMESIQAYVIVHQKRFLVELHKRIGRDEWQLVKLGIDDDLLLDKLPCGIVQVPIAEIYDGLELPRAVKEEDDFVQYEAYS